MLRIPCTETDPLADGESHNQAALGLPGSPLQHVLLTLGAAMLASGVLWAVPKDQRDTQLIVSEYLFCLLVTLLILSLLRWLRSIRDRVPEYLLPGPACVLLLSFVLACLATFGMRQFGGYDYSILILTGWAPRSGLVPYRDVICTFPPLFVSGAEHAFRLFGVRWSAFVWMAGIFALLTFFWLVAQLCASGWSLRWSALVAFTVEMGTVMVGSMWWHGTAASVVVILVFVSALTCLKSSQLWWNWLSMGLASGLLLLVKPNSWPVGACVLILFTVKNTRARILAIASAALAVSMATLFCAVHGFTFIDVLRSYAKVAGTRGNPFSLEIFSGLLFVERELLLLAIIGLSGILVLMLARGHDEVRVYRREYGCCIAVALAGMWMTFTNFEMKTSDAIPVIVAVLTLAYRPWSSRRFTRAGRYATIPILVLCLVVSSYCTVTRLRVRLIGDHVFFEHGDGLVISEGFFAGLHTGPRFVQVLEQMKMVLQQHPADRVFFGPRMEFGYAAFDYLPVRDMPLFWHPGSGYTIDEVPQIVNAFNRRRCELLVFLRSGGGPDFTRMPFPLIVEIRKQYKQITDFDQLIVFVRNQP